MPRKMPFSPDRITGWYGDPRPNGRIHLGVDWWADRGTPILASGSGFVRRKSYSSLGGYQVVVAYDDGQDWIYYHSDKEFPIAVGAKVQEGTVLGYVGSLGAASSGPHVHVEVYMYPSSNTTNPMDVMDRNLWVGQGGIPSGGEVIIGADALQVQLNLRLLGYYLGDLDGDPGPQTKKAIVDFQTAEQLDPDGVAGPITNGRLWQRVKEIQDKLNRLGYSLVVDGENGDATAGAVRDLQSKHGLVVDGIAGPATRAKISELLATPPVPIPPTEPPKPNEDTEASVTPKMITPSARDFPLWVRYEEKFDHQVMGSPTWNLNAYRYYDELYVPVESHCHWWGLPNEAGTHDGNVEYLNKTQDVGANYVTSPKRITLTTPLDKIALTTGKFNPRAWKSENDPIMTTPEGREWGYKTLAVLHYLIERDNPSLRHQSLKLHKDYYATRCSDIDVAYLREVIEMFFSGALDFATGMPPVVTPDPEPNPEPGTGLDPNEFPLLVELKVELGKLRFKGE